MEINILTDDIAILPVSRISSRVETDLPNSKYLDDLRETIEEIEGGKQFKLEDWNLYGNGDYITEHPGEVFTNKYVVEYRSEYRGEEPPQNVHSMEVYMDFYMRDFGFDDNSVFQFKKIFFDGKEYPLEKCNIIPHPTKGVLTCTVSL